MQLSIAQLNRKHNSHNITSNYSRIKLQHFVPLHTPEEAKKDTKMTDKINKCKPLEVLL